MNKKHLIKVPPPPEDTTYEELDEYYTKYDTEDLLKAGFLQEATSQDYQELKQNLGKRPKKTQVNFRLSEDELKLLKKVAEFKSIPYGTLARSWIIEKLRSEIKLIKESK